MHGRWVSIPGTCINNKTNLHYVSYFKDTEGQGRGKR